ncbi:blasticidin-S acetyltransferase [Streptomyces agglomeratus]|uniref:Blasticidin-S acetyltransferase n=1 Tax=Streptomyces agglomeratus TaxID=285458 RepID=A0A1E5PAA9_9ACTN|nr:GNAT family N-acetyltransferase [Streptomyces agglomeratus]OEJ26496.1 blasticidin-S acetyltransferase [Streptomyces agglomeratus]OEJ39438.1 blasticidin-S acetyltransferase [Streptomyces agglomeratus]OEJ46178.1 blasticidin-S acetyltransferase [Streptomyces agglomeratus]OEJ51961.1 blasticidin-S acetyltransferase [Streptomyces agglomeratus]OEJ59360.1 blasticidin-S acetyltransferase [Streptomyces agglomeratus]
MFRIETEVDKERRTVLGERLEAANAGRSPAMAALRGSRADDEIPLQVWALDEQSGELIAGLDGFTWGHWLHVGLLWVADAHRGAGLGSGLLKRAETTAREERGCGDARLETWDFQAPEFYRRLGYEIVGRVDDYPPGVTEFILTKRLE